MLAALNRLLKRTHDTPPEARPAEVVSHPVLDDLAKRVRELELDRADLLQEWQRTREQWIRYLKRQGALKQRSPEPVPELELIDQDEDEDRDLDRLILLRKLGNG